MLNSYALVYPMKMFVSQVILLHRQIVQILKKLCLLNRAFILTAAQLLYLSIGVSYTEFLLEVRYKTAEVCLLLFGGYKWVHSILLFYVCLEILKK